MSWNCPGLNKGEPEHYPDGLEGYGLIQLTGSKECITKARATVQKGTRDLGISATMDVAVYTPVFYYDTILTSTNILSLMPPPSQMHQQLLAGSTVRVWGKYGDSLLVRNIEKNIMYPVSDPSWTMGFLHSWGIPDNKTIIWYYLKNNLPGSTNNSIISDMHLAAIMGNISVESNFIPTNAQDSWYPGDHNPEYIPLYNIHDGIGWGLIQWTFHSVKQGLLDHANNTNRSVGDLFVQLEFLVEELTVGEYKNKYPIFLTKSTIELATEYFVNEIENAGIPHLARRIQDAQTILGEYGN